MKLLDRTIKNYLLYSILLVISCTPLFYFSIRYLFEHDMDEVLIAHKDDFNRSIAYMKSGKDIDFYHLMNKEFVLRPTAVLPLRDSLFTLDLYDSSAATRVPHRIFSTGVTVNGQHYELQIRESMVNTRSLIGAIMSIQVLMLSLLLGGLVLINRRLSKKIWSPFYILLERVKKYQIDQDKTLELPPSSTAEFRDLGLVIRQLIDKNHDAYQSQKEFTENASHELQTPLAISRAKLELLAQTKELTQEQAELVENLLDSIDRLTRLNKSLLLLSKIENRQFFETEDISLKAVVNRSIEAYHRQARERHISVNFEVTEDAVLRINPIILEVLTSNLISNAIRYTPDQGEVMIKQTGTQLQISNTGLPLQHPEKLFERFHRESRTILGSGLGLALVKKICEVSNYQVSYRYSSAMHHFIISF
ncbi:MAG: hypothetical protein DI538_05690 [Azospira oryzae]|jgi:two-component system sensor histidine kinase ArlS|nr:MAG: hypothetical protein DI538_05690 [Azospira oryzae]